MVTISELEQQVKDFEQEIELRDEARALCQNRLFKKIILGDFMTKDCARYAQESVDETLRPESRANALGMAQAAGYLKRWLELREQFGARAEGQVGRIKEEIEAMRGEEA